MTTSNLTLPNASLAGNNPEEVFLSIAAEAEKMGFEFCVHGMRIPVPITRPRTNFFTNYPPEWQERYTSQDYIKIDPTVAHGMRSSLPVLWSDSLFSKAPQLWAEAQSHGLRYGWAQSRHDADGVYSMLILARSAEPITPAELNEKDMRIQWLVQASHTSMKAKLDKTELKQDEVKLSDREIDVLRWTADGKTSSEIADILCISERTVNFHVNNVVAKLGACNKINATVRAAMLGLLWGNSP